MINKNSQLKNKASKTKVSLNFPKYRINGISLLSWMGNEKLIILMWLFYKSFIIYYTNLM